jgi:hypothetical protein
MTERSRLPLGIYSEALNRLQAEPGPLTPEKAELLRFLRELVDNYGTSQRLISSPGRSTKRP